MIDEAYSKHTWHGTNLRGSIRGISAQQAAWRPGKNRHNAWEVVVHCAYWKYTVARRITGEKRGSFPLKGSNWFKRPTGKVSTRDWQRDVNLLNTMHRKLREVVASRSSCKLSSHSPKRQWTVGADDLRRRAARYVPRRADSVAQKDNETVNKKSCGGELHGVDNLSISPCSSVPPQCHSV